MKPPVALFATIIAVLAVCPHARAQLVAEQVTTVNASARLFGGTDADGGVGDWYVSNGIVEAIVDGVGPQPDLVALLGAAAPPKQSEAAPTGGSLIDLGRVGADNDQLGQLFTVGGLSTANFILYDMLTAATDASAATITATGALLGFAPGVPPVNLPLETRYSAAGSDPFLTVTTTVTNTHPTNTAPGLGGFLDAIIWTQRAIVPFSPLAGRGFRHALFDLANPAAALELPPFAAGPGNVSPVDGIMDPPTGEAAGAVAYGLLGVEASLDPDGAGPGTPVIVPVDTLFGVSSNLVTALGNLPIGSLPPRGRLIYTRRLYVGDRNDVASVASEMIEAIAGRQGFATGTVSGDVDATDTTEVAASIIATKTGEVCTQGAVGNPCAGDAACDAAPGSGDGLCGGTPGFAAGVPVTHFRTDAEGAFAGIVLPVGLYRLEVRSVERDTVTVTGAAVTPGTDTVVPIPLLSGLGSLELTVRERMPGSNPPVPAKITLKGIGGTPDPALRKDVEAFVFRAGQPDQDITPETFAGGPGQRNFLYLADGSETIALRPGRYEIYASRGPEYTVRRRRVTVIEGAMRRRVLRIRRLVDTTGWVSGDFHIHSARSFDASPPLRDRVTSFAGEGVEVMVSTDHDYHVDYGPIIAGLGLGDRITSIVGNEVTTTVPNPPVFPNAVGHINAWPVPVDPTARRDGSIEDEYVAPNFIYGRLRAQGAHVIQYNHPRAGAPGGTSIGFFNNIGCNRCANDIDTTCTVDVDCPVTPAPQDCACVGYQPDRTLTEPPNDVLLDDDVTGSAGVANPDGFRNLDFDVMEIANGTDIASYLEVRRDWLSLLNQVDFVTVPFIPGTAVSDSHRLVLEAAGYFRTYVGGAGDDPATLDVDLFDASVRAGRMVGTSGPFIEFAVEDEAGVSAGPGETLIPATPHVTLSIRVQATNWIPVDEVRVIVNGVAVTPALVFDATTSPAVRSGPPSPLAQSARKVVRFEATVAAQLSNGDAHDAYFMVEAGARLDPLPTPPAFVDTIVPGMVPLAFTNPIFVDVDGDGFEPPGLPALASAAETFDTFGLRSRGARVGRLDQRPGRAGWLRSLVARLTGSSRAVAGEARPELPRQDEAAEPPSRSRHAGEGYFPLYEFRIPESAVEDAIEDLPEPARGRIKNARERVQSSGLSNY